MKNLTTLFLSLILCVAPLWVTAASKKAHQMPPALITVITAKKTTWQPSIQATGTLVADQGVTLKSDISGRVTGIFFKSGQKVKKDDPLVQLFPDVLQAQLTANEAKLKLATLNYKRYADLNKQQAISKQAYDQAVADYNQALANVDQTKAQLKQALITAPFDGYLGIRKVSLGDYVSAGQVVVNLEDTNPIYVDFTVPEVYAKRVQPNQPITISASAYGNKQFSGKVTAVDSLIDPNTRTLEIRAAIPNDDNYLIPGSFVEVKLLMGSKQSVFSLPQTAVLYSTKGPYVYTIIHNKAHQTPIKLGNRGTMNVNVENGLKSGDVIVATGLQRLHEGANVIIKKVAS